MALARYESVAVNLAGDVIPNATVEVREDRPGRPVVPLWADRNGTVPLGNPITTDSEGKFGFHVTGGSFYIRVFTGPSQQPLQQYVRRYQAIGTAAERDVEDLATALEAGTATFPTLADLEVFIPTAEGVGGKVTTGSDAGFYHYDDVAEEWVFDRPLFDSLARMNVTGGDENGIEADTALGVDDAAIVMLWIEAPETNTGPVSINGKSVLTTDDQELLPGRWVKGRTYWFSDEGANYKLRTDSDVSDLVAQAEAAAEAALTAQAAAEAAAAGAGVTDGDKGDVTVSDSGSEWFLTPGSKADVRNNLEVCPEDFGTITYGRSVTEAEAIANRDAIQAAHDFLAGLGGGTIRYRPGKIYEVHRSGANAYALLFDADNIWHVGHGSCIRRQYDADDPFSFIRLGDEPVGSTTNGRPGQVNGGGMIGLEIDGGCDIQLITNGKAFDGTTGWAALGSVAVTTVGGTTAQRAFRVTVTGAGGGRVYQAIPTEIGATYYVLCEVGAGTSASWNVIASATNAASGSIAQQNMSTKPDGRVVFEFTATGATSYILMNLGSDNSAAQYRDFRDLRVWESSDQDSMPMIFASGAKDYLIDGCHLHDSRHYLVGLQNGGYEGVRIVNSVFEDSFMDAIDHKNNGSVSYGNVMDNCVFRRCGLKNEPVSGTASVDLSRGWTVSNLQILEVGAAAGAAAGLRFKIGELDSTPGRGFGGRYCHASGIFVEADLQATSAFTGIHAMNKDCEVANFTVLNAGVGIWQTDSNNKFINGTIENCNAEGILVEDKPTSPSFPETFGDQGRFTNITVRGCAVGASLSGDKNILRDCLLTGNVINFENTGTDNAVFGGEIGTVAGVTTKQVTNSGTRLRMSDVLGFETKKHLTTASISVAALGTSATQTTAHGLGYTPALADVLMGAVRDTSAAYAATFDVVGVSSTHISWRCNTVEVEAGATGKAHIHIDTLTLPSIS